MINWKVRVKSKAFWVAIIPAILLLVQVVAAVFGYALDLGDLGNRLLAVVNAVFAVLAILGVVVDPTTAGVADSARAMGYTTPVHSDTDKTEREVE
jgi:phi LC3 family holin